MPKSPSGDSIQSLRSRWNTAKRQRLLDKLIGQRCFAGFFSEQDEVSEDPALIKDLRGADLSARDLHDILLLNADMRWVDFTGSRVQGPFQHTNLTHAEFARAELTACRFWKARLINTQFEGARLTRCSFEQANLFGASFCAAQLTDCEFESSDLRNVLFAGARLSRVILRRVKLNAAERDFWRAFTQEQCLLEEVEWCEEAPAEALAA